jgi:anti-repressor protein
MMARSLDPDEKGLSIVETPGGQQEMVIVSEPGLYKLIEISNKPVAKRCSLRNVEKPD